ncbi:hypothetical protein AMAG_11421 [Allomyces macrogynus ATCC 38327]|uniref:Galactose oxidase n=1 Tax=Allomyces macrogynus (strain ATCC 38327) TaxID=578462 RepID=A0A0L0SWR0_ALLM3|nr:hypothetical protein AMAG_11421 [Allomyces macrogynus ATCC 38327]|eukprot:KNE66947.1 hypothetical protein AMAG_11421 [Allomyces macrogynus ATCC 38327]
MSQPIPHASFSVRLMQRLPYCVPIGLTIAFAALLLTWTVNGPPSPRDVTWQFNEGWSNCFIRAGATLTRSAMLYLPRSSVLYVMGGRAANTGAECIDVAAVDLSRVVDLTDPDDEAVTTADWTVPEGAWLPVAVQRDNATSEVVDLWMHPLGEDADARRPWVVHNVVNATKDNVGHDGIAGPVVSHPAYSAGIVPISYAAKTSEVGNGVYAFGGWPRPDPTLWRSNLSEPLAPFAPANASSTARPVARGFGALIRYDANRLVLAGGTTANSTWLHDVWTYHVANGTWDQYPHPLTNGYDSVQATTYTTRDARWTFLLVAGARHGSNLTLEYANLALATPFQPVPITIPDIGTNWTPAALTSTSAPALAIHDDHLFLASGGSASRPATIRAPKHTLPLSAILLDYDPSTSTLTGTWAPAYVPLGQVWSPRHGLGVGAIVGIVLGSIYGLRFIRRFWWWYSVQKRRNAARKAERERPSMPLVIPTPPEGLGPQYPRYGRDEGAVADAAYVQWWSGWWWAMTWGAVPREVGADEVAGATVQQQQQQQQAPMGMVGPGAGGAGQEDVAG